MTLLIPLLLLILQERAAVPDPTAQKEAEKLVRDLFKEEYAKKSAADKAALAERMLLQSRESKDDATTRYVLLREAQELFSQAGELEKSLGTIDELGRLYAVETLALKSVAMASATKVAKTPEDFVRLAQAQLRFSNDALQVDQYDTAEKSAQAAGAAARKAGATGLAARSAAKSKEIADLKSKYEKLKKARETLASSPDDASANLAIGYFQSVIKGNWELGLPLLLKGSDAALKSASEKDLAAPKEAADQAAAGDAWWDLADKENATAKENLRSRALFWYGQAEDKLTGLLRTKISKRVLDTRMETINRGTWVDVSDPKLYGRGQTPLNVGPNRTPLDKFPPGTYDGLTVRAKPKSAEVAFGIQFEKESRDMELSTQTGMFAVRHAEGTSWKPDVTARCPNKEEYIITLLIVDGEHVFYLDGREVGRLRSINDKIQWVQFYGFVGNTQFDQIKLRKKD